ncbi:MAG: leucyl aminopeptidase [Rhizobiaceae bacterium]|nr:leucyl aminopeptidase [Rhizobiaceae bacterium]
MAKLPTITFSKNAVPTSGTLVAFIADGAGVPPQLADSPAQAQLERAMKVDGFTGKKGSSLSLLGVEGGLDSIIVMGCGTPDELTEPDLLKLGGKLLAAIGKADKVHVLTESNDKSATLSPQQVATIAAGAKLRAYNFDDYLTKGREADKKQTKAKKISFGTSGVAAAKKAWAEFDGVTDGVLLARQLVNEPANVLGPVEFAKQAQKLKSLGVKVQVLTVAEMKKLGMHALLGVSQGSATNRQARMAIMQWDGGKKGDQPLAFIGKGVVFDTGGISIKPSGGMEDMKGDMGGAAAVTGLMHALAARKAKANVVGIIGLVENMPDANAQRPGDIVKSMSGQTIEIINTDAEGRLVLADALWYCQKRFKPKFMINLATLTGAILVALGKEHAGIFSNNDELAENLHKAGQLTDEKVWRLPLHEAYDKMIDTKNADMKNTGGRFAGSITAGQFLQRFVNDVPWVHIDVAGTAMAAPKNEYNQSWGSGYGVRLLSKLVQEFYE